MLAKLEERSAAHEKNLRPTNTSDSYAVGDDHSDPLAVPKVADIVRH